MYSWLSFGLSAPSYEKHVGLLSLHRRLRDFQSMPCTFLLQGFLKLMSNQSTQYPTAAIGIFGMYSSGGRPTQ